MLPDPLTWRASRTMEPSLFACPTIKHFLGTPLLLYIPLDECPNKYWMLQEVAVNSVRLCWYACMSARPHYHTKFSPHTWCKSSLVSHSFSIQATHSHNLLAKPLLCVDAALAYHWFSRLILPFVYSYMLQPLMIDLCNNVTGCAIL